MHQVMCMMMLMRVAGVTLQTMILQERDKEVVTLTGAVPVSGPRRLLVTVTKEGETFPKLNEDTDPGHPASIQPS